MWILMLSGAAVGVGQGLATRIRMEAPGLTSTERRLLAIRGLGMIMLGAGMMLAAASLEALAGAVAILGLLVHSVAGVRLYVLGKHQGA